MGWVRYSDNIKPNEGQKVLIEYNYLNFVNGMYTETMQNETKDGYLAGVLADTGGFIPAEKITWWYRE